jgi:signal transduction histidine kinase
MLQLKITQKGMLIVSVPLIFETMFILLLLILLTQINDHIEREEKSRAILSRAHHFGRMAINISSALAALRFDMDEGRASEKLDANMKGAQNDIAEMREIAGADPAEAKMVEDVAQHLEYAKAFLKPRSQLSDIGKGSKLDTIYNDPLVQETAEYVASLNGAVQQLVATEQRTAAESREAVDRTKKAIEFVLVGGLAASILITVWLTVFFSRNIIQRIHNLAANAAFLGRRQPLSLDVTGHDEIAELDAALRRTDAELAQLERTRQNLIAFVSHELKTPLTSLSAFYSLLSNDAFLPLDDTARELSSRAGLRLDDINRLIIDLIDIEKMQGGKFRLLLSDVDLPTLIDMAIDKYKRDTTAVADGGAVPTFEIVEVADSVITGDRDRLVRVLINLFRNSAKRAKPDSSVVIFVFERPDWVEFQIVDSGEPIPGPLRACVFERDQLTGDAHSLNLFLADGLPLVISRMIVEQHGGTFEVVSDNVGKTIFNFKIPTELSTDPELDGLSILQQVSGQRRGLII